MGVSLKSYTLQSQGADFPYVIAHISHDIWDTLYNVVRTINYNTFEDALAGLLRVSPLFQYCTGSYFGINDMYFENINQIWTEKFLYGGTHPVPLDKTTPIHGNVYNADNTNNYVIMDISNPSKFGDVHVGDDVIRHVNNYSMFCVDDFTYAQCGILVRFLDLNEFATAIISISKSSNRGYSIGMFPTPWEQNQLYYLFNGYDGDDYDDYPDPDDPYKDAETGDDGGGGTPDWNSDPITERTLPTSFYGESGLVSVFTPTMSELNALSTYLWSGNFDLSSFKKIVNNPFDLILGLSYIPFKVVTGGARSINVGNITNTGLTMTYPTQENYSHDFGSLSINEQYKNFSDYAPHTRIKIHLPFIGTQEIDPDLIRRGAKNDTTVKLKYKYNIVNGTICAYLITGNNKLLYQWTGNALTPIPVANNDYTNMYKGLANLASSAVSGAVSGGVLGGAVGGGVGALVGGALGAVHSATQGGIDTMSSLKPTITTTGGIGSSGAILNATNDAYFIIEQPEITVPRDFRHYVGLPRNIVGLIKDESFYGYNEILSCRMSITNATDSEKSEIETILKTGYIYGDPNSGVTSKPTIPNNNALQLALYQTKTSNNRIDKKCSHLHTYTDIVLKDNVSITHPTIKLRASDANILKGNYCYIPKFKRYYYVSDIRNLGGWKFDEENQRDLYMWELDLRCDVLMSFRDEIIKHKAVFTKSESGWNLYLNDSNIQIDNRTRTIIKKFPNSLTNDATYVLLMAGA